MKKKGFTLEERICRSACRPRQGARRNKAFTLAEVLITLVIIGVIGALTVPSLIQSTQKQEYVTALKKAYSTLSQATQQIIAEEGSPKGDAGWADSIEHIYELYKKHLNNAKECSGDIRECGILENYKTLGGWYDNNFRGRLSNNGKSLILSDGIQLIFSFGNSECSISNNYDDSSQNVCSYIFADLNGAKKPNQFGRDVFGFAIKENGFFPLGCDNVISDESACSTKAGHGFGCACKVLREGAMNY